MSHTIPKVAVILNVHLPYDRKIIQGIASFLRNGPRWALYLEDDPLHKLPALNEWQGDGLIVDFDDPRVAKAVRGLKIPVVGLGGGQGWYDACSRVPYFETDDQAIAHMAAEHLLELGLKDFAYCGLPPTRVNVWSAARARSFTERLADQGYSCNVFRSRFSSTRNWQRLQQELVDWLTMLPKPLGLMACNDARARHVLEGCQAAGISVPDDVAVIGVDNDDIMCELVVPPLTSVEQGAFHLGHDAAAMLHSLMAGKKPERVRYRVAPVGIVTRESTDMLATNDPDVATALRLIRCGQCSGLSAEMVAAHVSLSRSTMDKRFKAVVGRTVDQEIRRVRLAKAKELLSGTNRPLNQIAREVGYATVQYLTEQVRKGTGKTPAVFRRETQNIGKSS